MRKLILIIIIVICSAFVVSQSGLPYAVWIVSIPAGLVVLAIVISDLDISGNERRKVAAERLERLMPIREQISRCAKVGDWEGLALFKSQEKAIEAQYIPDDSEGQNSGLYRRA